MSEYKCKCFERYEYCEHCRPNLFLSQPSQEIVPVDGWQSIETAPMDGEDYLFADCRVSGGFQEVLFWDDEKSMWAHKDGKIYYPIGFFTHWMNLPQPPCKG